MDITQDKSESHEKVRDKGLLNQVKKQIIHNYYNYRHHSLSSISLAF